MNAEVTIVPVSNTLQGILYFLFSQGYTAEEAGRILAEVENGTPYGYINYTARNADLSPDHVVEPRL